MGGSVLLDRFDEIDTDKSGQLSRDEVKAWTAARQQEMRQRVEDHVKAADTNGDGQISLEEAKAKLPMAYDHFEFLDANKDGQISMAEFERLRDPGAMRAEFLGRLKAADKDNDGKLNLAEVQVAFPDVAARFSQLDKDNDRLPDGRRFRVPEGPALTGQVTVARGMSPDGGPSAGSRLSAAPDVPYAALSTAPAAMIAACAAASRAIGTRGAEHDT